MLIVLVGTGTAGHVYAAVALADELVARGHQVHFLASEHGVENTLLADLQLPLHTIPSKPFFRVNFLDRIRAMISFCRCIILIRQKLTLIKPDLVFGFGGHVSAASILAARSLGFSTAIHEANALAGFGNRLVKKIVDKIYLGSLARTETFKKNSINIIGSPIRSTLTKGKKISVFDQENIHLLILGGSDGADFLNRNMACLIQTMRSKGITLEVTHQAGEKGVEIAKSAYRTLDQEVTIIAYAEDMTELYEHADFVISSAGAGTIAELCIWGLPCFLLPLAEASENHQEENARELTKLLGEFRDGTNRQKKCFWISEHDWNEDVVSEQIFSLFDIYQELSFAMRMIAKPNAAIELAKNLEQRFSNRQ